MFSAVFCFSFLHLQKKWYLLIYYETECVSKCCFPEESNETCWEYTCCCSFWSTLLFGTPYLGLASSCWSFATECVETFTILWIFGRWENFIDVKYLKATRMILIKIYRKWPILLHKTAKTRNPSNYTKIEFLSKTISVGGVGE